MEYKRLKLSDLVPYENNPRINYFAVEPVMESIKQVGYIAPIIVDENNVILAGHTRFSALQNLGYEEAECVVVSGLSDEQKRKYRILDNKTGEVAEWDEDLLKGELEGLDLGDIHWFDNLVSEDVAEMAKGAAEKKPVEEDDGVVRCPRCGAVLEDSKTMPFSEDDDETVNWLNEEAES